MNVDGFFLDAGRAAATEWGYPAPGEDWLGRFNDRLPLELRTDVARAFAEGDATLIDGHRFTIGGLSPGKGPYAMFSKSGQRQEPAPNWEYFVQLVVWLEVRTAMPDGLMVGFEDDLLDVSVRTSTGDLLWAIEVKEKAAQLTEMLDRLHMLCTGVDLEAADRGNDPLRKAKYLVRHRPPWFTLWAIGARFDFAVTYPRKNGFELLERAVSLG